MKFLANTVKIVLPIIVIIGGIFTWNKFKDLPQQIEEGGGARIESSNKLSKEEKLAQKKQGIPVIAHPLRFQEHQVIITSRGSVEAGEDLELSADTEGTIVNISKDFEVGTIVKKGAILLTIDDADLQDNLIVAKARVAQAEASLAQEVVRAEQALVNWNELGYTEEPSDLVLRKPQLRQEQANLEAAIAQVELAKRQLERVKLIAPFDGIVAERSVSLGERVSRGRSIGHLISTEYSKISLQVSSADQRFLSSQLKGAEVTFANSLLGTESPTWDGYVLNLDPQVDPASKQLTLITRIIDPYSLNGQSEQTLPTGQPVTAKIKGKVLKDIYIIPKSALRDPNKIHVMTPDKRLSSLEITPLLTDSENIIFHADLQGDFYWVETVLPKWKEGDLLIQEQSLSQQEDQEDKKEKL